MISGMQDRTIKKQQPSAMARDRSRSRTEARMKTTRSAPHQNEDGYVLVAVMFMLALLIISLAVAVPRVRKQIQRDQDLETYHRGMQYRRAIQLYFKKFHAYPPNLDALVMTNNIRFLRKRYTDPITRTDDWKPIYFGQAKLPMAYGFFGQPLGGEVLAGTGQGGIAGASPIGSPAGSTNGSVFGGSSSFAGGSSLSSGSSIFGSNSQSNSPTQTGSSTSTTGGTNSGGGSSSNAPTSSNQTFGGGGIVGFEPASPKQSILVYKKKNHYIEWEFTYSPLSDQAMISGGNAGTIGQPAGSGGFGSGPGGIGLGSGGITGGGLTPAPPTPPTTPTTPQP